MSPIRRVAIVGYGVAGIAAASRLHRMGLAVERFERSGNLRPGGGMLLQPPALRRLGEIGVLDKVLAAGVPVRRLAARTHRGRRLFETSLSADAVGIERSRLIEIMRAGDAGGSSLLCDTKIVDACADRGLLRSADGNVHGPFDLVVAADGANSRLRASLPRAPRRNRLYRTRAWVSCLDVSELATGDCIDMVFDRQRHVSVWPVARAVQDLPARFNVSMNLSADTASADWSNTLSRLHPALWNARNPGCPEIQPLRFDYRDVVLDSVASGRLVLIGDAAHSMSPQLGQGVRLALDDAHDLAACLARMPDIESALRSYDRSCRARAEPWQRTSRWMTPWFQSESRVVAWSRDRMLSVASHLPGVERHVVNRLAQ